MRRVDRPGRVRLVLRAEALAIRTIAFAVTVEQEHRHVRGRQRLRHVGLRQDQAGRGIAQKERQSLSRMGRIEREIGAARFQDPEQPHDHLRGAVDTEGDAGLRSDTEVVQPVRQPVGAAIQAAIGQKPIPAGDRHRLRRLPHPRLEQGGQTDSLCVGHPASSRPGRERPALGVADQRQIGDAAIGPRHDSFEERLEMPDHAVEGRRVEQIGVVLPDQGDPFRDPRGRPAQELFGPGDDGEVQIELGRPVAQRLHQLDLDARQIERLQRGIVEAEHHLEDWVVAEIARRSQRLDHRIERHILMVVRLERRAARAGEQLAKRRIALKPGAQRHRVDDHPDQPLGLLPAAIGDAGADAEVVLPRVTMQERLQRRQQRHEERHAFAPAEEAQRFAQRCGQLDATRRPAVALQGGSRAIARQLQKRRAAGELAPPVIELALGDAFPQPLPLPLGEIGELDPRLGQRRRFSGREGPVERGKLAQENIEGPPVMDQVMFDVQQDPLAPA